jgi:hypothetical protein
MPEQRDEQGLQTGRSQITLGTRLIACSGLVGLAQLLLWFKEGQWPLLNIAELLRLIGAGASISAGSGAAAIVEWLLAIPIAAGIAAIGFVFAWMGASKLVAASESVASKS